MSDRHAMLTTMSHRSAAWSVVAWLGGCTTEPTGDPCVGECSGTEEDSGSEVGDSSGEGDGDTGDGDGGGDGETGEADGSEGETDGDAETETETGTETDTGDCDIFETTEVRGCAEIVGEGFCSEHGSHVDQGSFIEWSNNPPHSGDHYPTTQSAGEHLTPVLRGNWVHNLEHGWIVLVHNCPDGCEPELDVLREVLDARPGLTILMTPDLVLDAPRFAAISWTWVFEFDEPVLEEILCFVDQHYDHAPE